jgi:hypothetical protein
MAEPPIVVAMSESTAVNKISISNMSPTPTDDEVVAIMAGVEALWPKPVVAIDTATGRSTAWRFSGRWWSRPVAARRDRPFR